MKQKKNHALSKDAIGFALPFGVYAVLAYLIDEYNSRDDIPYFELRLLFTFLIAMALILFAIWIFQMVWRLAKKVLDFTDAS